MRRGNGFGKPPTARTVLGVPVLPPPVITITASRLRAAVRRLHHGMAPPPVRILETLFGVLEHPMLVALCDLGVPDALDRRMDVPALAARVGADPGQLARVLRYAANRGWVHVDRRGRVRPTRTTAFLRRDHPGGWRAWVDFLGSAEVAGAARRLAATLTTPAAAAQVDAFRDANGATFFEYLAAHPDLGHAFDRAMEAGARTHALALAAGLDWSEVRTVCDVGGGTGELARVLVERVPGLTAAVFDLPHVVAVATPHERVTAVGGDMFTAVPAGHDAYLLVVVLHDWSDDDAVRILTRIAEAAHDAARVIVVDADPATGRHNDLAVATDIMMAALTRGGRERTADDIARLGAAAGLRLVRTTPLATGDVVHDLRPAAT